MLKVIPKVFKKATYDSREALMHGSSGYATTPGAKYDQELNVQVISRRWKPKSPIKLEQSADVGFDDAGAWTVGTGAAVTGGQCVLTDSLSSISDADALPGAGTYEVTVDIDSNEGTFSVGSETEGQLALFSNESGVHTKQFTITGASTTLLIKSWDLHDPEVVLNSCSVKKIYHDISSLAVAASAGASYSLDGGAFTSDAGVWGTARQIRARITSSASYETTVTATITIGGVGYEFPVTTMADPMAAAFAHYTDQENYTETENYVD